MEKTSIVLMEKDPETGFLSKELGTYAMDFDLSLIDRAFVTNENGQSIVNLYVTVPGDFKDWEFNAILDNYDTGLYDGKALSIEEDEESYNPAWLIKFDFLEDDDALEKKLNELMKIHSDEIERVIKAIKNLEDEYKE